LPGVMEISRDGSCAICRQPGQ